jgi:hypothetical protein
MTSQDSPLNIIVTIIILHHRQCSNTLGPVWHGPTTPRSSPFLEKLVDTCIAALVSETIRGHVHPCIRNYLTDRVQLDRVLSNRSPREKIPRWRKRTS